MFMVLHRFLNAKIAQIKVHEPFYTAPYVIFLRQRSLEKRFSRRYKLNPKLIRCTTAPLKFAIEMGIQNCGPNTPALRHLKNEFVTFLKISSTYYKFSCV